MNNKDVVMVLSNFLKSDSLMTNERNAIMRLIDNQKKIDESIRLLSTVLCAFNTKQELLDWSVKQQNTLITYMVTTYFVLTDGEYERFKGDGHLGVEYS